jgi:DNA-binding NarL/FixJ family response regulator
MVARRAVLPCPCDSSQKRSGKATSMTYAGRPLLKHPVLIVDDHPIVRKGLMDVINEAVDLTVCGEAASVPEALQKVEATRPDVVIVDISLGGEDGIELIDYIKSRWPAVKMLVSSAHDEKTFAGRVLRAGALGFISKREPLPRVVEAVRKVLRVEVYLSTEMATCLLQRAAVGESLDNDPVQSLSNRELQVFEMIGDGLNTREIARRLGISPKTVESHRKVIKTKLNAQTSAQLNRRAYQWVQENR